MWCLLITTIMVFLAPAFPNTWPFRSVLFSPFLLSLNRLVGAHLVFGQGKKGDAPQVFLADGGHIDNSAVLPLLRRRRTTIIAVDASPDRELASIRTLLFISSQELECVWRPPAYETESDDVEQYLKDFGLPRARFVIDQGSPMSVVTKLFSLEQDGEMSLLDLTLAIVSCTEPGINLDEVTQASNFPLSKL